MKLSSNLAPTTRSQSILSEWGKIRGKLTVENLHVVNQGPRNVFISEGGGGGGGGGPNMIVRLTENYVLELLQMLRLIWNKSVSLSWLSKF